MLFGNQARRYLGHSLGEVLLAIVLISVPILALISTYGAQLRATRNNNKRDLANTIAISTLSRVERQLWSFFQDDVSLERQPVPEEEGFEFEIQVLEAPPALKHVLVRVFWTESGRDLSLDLETKFIEE